MSKLNPLGINIIGGAGFIGTRLAETLIKLGSYKIKIIDKRTSSLQTAAQDHLDILYVNDLIQSIDDSSIVINLAAEHADNVSPISLYYDVNVQGAINVCQAARIKNVNTIVFTSSVAVYGENNSSGTDESCIPNPSNHYGKSKLEAEKVYLKWQSELPQNRRLLIVRPAVVFGEGNRGNVFNLIKQIDHGKFLMIGGGENRKSMVYVGNLVEFLLHCLDLPVGTHIFNYVDHPDLSMNQLVECISFSLKKKLPSFRMPFFIGYFFAILFDLFSFITKKKMPISSLRLRKFCSPTIFKTIYDHKSFLAPFDLIDGIKKTIDFDFRPGDTSVDSKNITNN